MSNIADKNTPVSYNQVTSPQKNNQNNLQFYAQEKSNIYQTSRPSDDDLFHKFDDEEDVNIYQTLAEQENANNYPQINHSKRQEYNTTPQNNSDEYSTSGVGQNLQPQNSLYYKKTQQNAKKNPFEILDKVNSYSKNNKFNSGNINRTFRKPGVSNMGYSQRATFDRKNTYSNVKVQGGNRGTVKNNQVSFKIDAQDNSFDEVDGNYARHVKSSTQEQLDEIISIT